MIPKWIVESFHGDNGTDELIEELKKQGLPHHAITYVPFKGGDYSKLPDDEPILYVGSVNLAEQLLEQKPGWRRGIWATFPNYDCTAYLPQIGDLCINGDYVLVPFADLWRQRWRLYGLFSEDSSIFIRPNAGTKEYTGAVIDIQHLKTQLDHWKDFTRPNSLAVISRPQVIKAEWRVIVARYGDIREVVASSLYRLDGNKSYLEGAPFEVLALAEMVLNKLNAPPDPMFAIDVALTNNGYRVVEINAFSSCGLYACDKKAVIEMGNRIAQDIYA